MDSHLWKRTQARLVDETNDFLEQWEYRLNNLLYLVGIKHFYSNWGTSAQVTILKKVDGKYLEPSMSEKLEIFEYTYAFCCLRKPIAFEVFPIKSHIVDRIDAYHTWGVEETRLPFFVLPKAPYFWKKWESVEINGKKILYTKKFQISTKGEMVLIYFIKASDHTELRWYDKQNFKDAIIGEDVLAIEPITEKKFDFSTLICAPKSIKKLPFGLK